VVVVHAVATDVTIPLSDGVDSKADVWIADAGNPGPTILIRTPYGKRTLFHQSPIDALAAVERGYRMVIHDVRGRGASGGEFVPFSQEQADGHDAIAWITGQSWSDGTVVMTGPSYVGATQWLAAREAPAALKAIAPLNSSPHFGDGWSFTNGVRELGFLTSWVCAALADESAGLHDRIDEADHDYERALQAFPAARPWFSASPEDPYWAAIDARPAEGTASAIPVLTVTGWYDIFVRGALSAFHERAQEHDRLIIGPWGHDNYFSHLNGGANLGFAGSGDAIRLGSIVLDFFDDALAGRRSRQPRVLSYELGSKHWVADVQWPPADVAEVRLPFPPRHFTVDLRDLPTLVGGRGLRVGTADSGWGPVVATSLESRADTAVCDIAELASELVIAGALAVTLDGVETREEDAQWVALLCTRDDQGTLTVIADGVTQQLAGSNTVEIPLGDLRARFSAGTRLAVVLCGGLRPRWQSPSTGGGYRRFAQSHLTVCVATAERKAPRPGIEHSQ